MIKKITSIIISIILILAFSTSVFADVKSQLQDKKQEVENQKSEVSKEKSAAMKAVEELNSFINDNQEKLDDLTQELNEINKEIKEIKIELEEAQKKYESQEELLKNRLTAQYETGETTFLDVLLNSGSFSDFLSNYFLVSEILENDSDLLTSIDNQKTKIEKDKQSIEEKQKSLKTKKAEQEKVQVLLNNQKVQKQNKISSLSQEEKDLQKKIDDYDELIRKEERNASQIAAGSTGVYVGGNKVWPCPASTRITSGYGERNTGIPGASTNHKGIDIGCPTGSSVVSVLNGKVIFTGYNAYRGYYIMVDHGGGVVTLYQHCTNSFKVSKGDTVKAGQTIVLSGSSGIGSGPHLHFEVIINGKNVNPLNWLKEQ